MSEGDNQSRQLRLIWTILKNQNPIYRVTVYRLDRFYDISYYGCESKIIVRFDFCIFIESCRLGENQTLRPTLLLFVFVGIHVLRGQGKNYHIQKMLNELLVVERGRNNKR